MRVKVGQQAHVVLSLGPRKMTVPSLQQRSLRAAQVEILRSGMQLGEISSAYLPGTDADTVVQQYPAPGATDVTSPRVNLLVALGPAPAAYVMPDLSGLPLTEADSKLAAAGLKVSRIDVTPAAGSAEAPPGTVIGQTPARGQRVDVATTIELRGAGQP
jgi:eukaryotic-like serine/threonine-protein kinase